MYKRIPFELIVLIFDYYIVRYFTKTDCYKCKSLGYKLIDCQDCDGIGYKINCKQCKQKIDCIKCNHGDIIRVCGNCDRNKEKMALDFNKLCHRQSLCSQCNKYFPNDMIFYWTICKHKYCYRCISLYIKQQIKSKQLPICVKSKCGEHLGIKELKSLNLSRNQTYYHNNLKILISENNRFTCNKCRKNFLPEEEFLWTKCKHKYCIKCALKMVNKSISFLNQKPKCIVLKCNESLSVKAADLIIDKVLPKYKINKETVAVYDRRQHLIFGYIRNIKKYIPHDIILSIFDYYCLIYYAKINCSVCKCRGIKHFDCENCNGYGYPPDCVEWNKTGIYHLPNKYCNVCYGHKIFTSPCTNCGGDKHKITLDFIKLCHKQSLCVKCNKYFPNDMIFYWDCYHTYCYQCIIPHIKNQINSNQLPVCLVPKCKQYLAMKQLEFTNIKESKYIHKLKSLISQNNMFKCNKCHNMTLPEQEFLWTKCKHKYCNTCAPKIINRALASNHAPVCIISQCDQLLDIRDADILKNSLLTRYQIDSPEMKKYYNENNIIATINCYSCNSKGFTFHNCTACNGFGYTENLKHPDHNIYKCRGFGFSRQKCRYCNATGKVRYICYKCGGSNRIAVLDFHKLFDDQLLCSKCDCYFTANMVTYWSFDANHCTHTLCDICIADYVENEIYCNRIPICPSSECFQEMTVQKLYVIPIELPLVPTLETLIYTKNRFKCTFCQKWHQNKNKFSWSNCNHKYGKKCVKFYVGQIIPVKESVLNNIFSKISVPNCYHKNCMKYLNLKDMSRIDLTEYQRKTLKMLMERNKSKEKKPDDDCILM